MSLLQPKQINKVIAAPLKIVNLTATAGTSSTNVTSVLTTILSTAANDGTSVPLQSSTSNYIQGVILASPMNRCDIFDTTTKKKLIGPNDEELYGRLTLVSSVYTLSYFYLNNAGVETAFTMQATSGIDFDFAYRFNFDKLPADALISSIVRNVNQDPKGQASIPIIERLTVTAPNTLSVLASIPTVAGKTILNINGKDEFAIGPSPSITLTGTNITWNAGNAGYTLETSDIVFVKYFI